MPDRLHFVQQFITVSCTCSKSNSSAKDLHADGLPREGTHARRGVCRACRRNKSNAGVRQCNEQLTCQGCARGFVTANKSRKSHAGFAGSFLLFDVWTCCAWRTRGKRRGDPDARESQDIPLKRRGGMMRQQIMKQKMRAAEYIDRSGLANARRMKCTPCIKCLVSRSLIWHSSLKLLRA